MKAVCETASGRVLFSMVDPGEMPAGRVAITLDAATAAHADRGVPLIWDGANTVTVDLDHVKSDLRGRIKTKRDAADAGGCTVPGIGRFDTDAASKLKILGAVVTAGMAGSAFSIDWRLADNSIVTLNAAQMAAVGLAVYAQVDAAQTRKNALDAAITAASTLAALEAINIEAGWPS